MLLELDPVLINGLLSDSAALQQAVAKAKEEYLKAKHPSVLAAREDIGDALYQRVLCAYPQNAAQITGEKRSDCSSLKGDTG